MKYFLTIIAAFILSANLFAGDEASPISAAEPKINKVWLNELGCTVPAMPGTIKTFMNTNNLVANPLTSGYGAGFQIGRHKVLNEKATLGLTIGGSIFATAGINKTQLYQANACLTGRAYLDNWSDGFFIELGSGVEFGMSSFGGLDFTYQVDIFSKVGLGYNYQVNKDVTLGMSLVGSPSLSASNILDGTKIVFSMLW